jgi:nitronate monooxygenase
MPIHTVLTGRLGLLHPIVQAPMAGGADTPALVAAVCEAGALGSIGAAYLTPRQIAAACQAVRSKTQRPFGINFFVPHPPLPEPIDCSAAIARVAPYFSELELPPPEAPAPSASMFDAQLAAALAGGAAVFSFTFGMPPAAARTAIKGRGLILAATATTVREAVDLERAGIDVIVAQGSEAGAHRGTFADSTDVGAFEAAMIGGLALVPQIVDSVSVPVVAAGGIMDGRGIAAALVLGAAGAQLGTAFLTCEEAGVPEIHKQAILDARDDDTRVTRAFSGRPARGIVNRFMIEVDAAGDVLPFPLQNALTRPLRIEAARRGRAEFLSLWAGQGLGMARRQPAGELVAILGKETEAAIVALSRSVRPNGDDPND